MRSILRRLFRSHSTAVAYLALFAALGGTAYAAVTVTGKNIKNGTITGKDVKNRSLGTKKLSAKALGSLTGKQGPAGPQGVPGATGPMGSQGPQGPPGPTASSSVRKEPATGTALNPSATVIDLASVNDSGDRQITTTFAGRIMATGHAIAYNASAVSGEFRCQLLISDGTGPNNGLTPMSSRGVSTTQAVSGVGQTQTLTGAAVKPPGTYNVQMTCHEATGNLAAEQATLVVWAAAPPAQPRRNAVDQRSGHEHFPTATHRRRQQVQWPPRPRGRRLSGRHDGDDTRRGRSRGQAASPRAYGPGR
jgi:hypothetical protein